MVRPPKVLPTESTSSVPSGSPMKISMQRYLPSPSAVGPTCRCSSALPFRIKAEPYPSTKDMATLPSRCRISTAPSFVECCSKILRLILRQTFPSSRTLKLSTQFLRTAAKCLSEPNQSPKNTFKERCKLLPTLFQALDHSNGSTRLVLMIL